ncbi:hypothetical protein XPR_0518 [Xanthomonas arboricola pv. pruni MAFF 301420]|uniref:Uncharacterized protein n=2 Tax=Xanthomonas arboricola pv. pruni TaxID=69929 RepID=W4SCG8_9XANT|nr:hypothetical protein XPU_4204 [Xanthomonas arboricola pv. pruni str. MAFF 311562]GAE53883.1 hypothetical protein XPR_0518 [Xanthomonas arboricola pv. pruni MAFF 301420]GAE61172.1 hypothetical protein XPN_3078 [Xanthomonas arboricola pv. pruni MAFF 301427]
MVAAAFRALHTLGTPDVDLGICTKTRVCLPADRQQADDASGKKLQLECADPYVVPVPALRAGGPTDCWSVR